MCVCKACKHNMINRHVNIRAWARQHGIALCMYCESTDNIHRAF